MLPYTSQEEDTYGKMGVARVPLFIIGLENNYGISQNLPFSHTSLNGLLQYLNLPYAKIYEFNRIPIDKIGVAYEEKPIFYQIHEPEDKVLVLFHEKQFVVHLKTFFVFHLFFSFQFLYYFCHLLFLCLLLIPAFDI